MRILAWSAEPIHEVPYRYARSGGGTAVGSMAFTRATVSGLPAELDALLVTADLQGRELIPPSKPVTAPHRLVGREGARLLGQVVAAELDGLQARGQLPSPDRLGILLAGDLWAEPGSMKRGGAGDVAPVWEALARRARWVAGVLGNHDLYQPPPRSPGLHLLDGNAVVLDGLRIGGVRGIIGNKAKLNRQPADVYLGSLATLLQASPDLVVLHACPDVPGERGEAAIRECLEQGAATVVLCGHCHWHQPLHQLCNGTQVFNVDSRVVVLSRAG